MDVSRCLVSGDPETVAFGSECGTGCGTRQKRLNQHLGFQRESVLFVSVLNTSTRRNHPYLEVRCVDDVLDLLGGRWFHRCGDIKKAADVDGLRRVAAIKHEDEISSAGTMPPDAGIDQLGFAVFHARDLHR